MNSTNRPKRKLWSIFASLVAVLALFATACASDSGTTTIDTSAVDEANDAAAAAAAEAQEAKDALAAMQADNDATQAELDAAKAAADEANAAREAAEADAAAAADAAKAAEEAAMAEGEDEGPTLKVAIVGNPNLEDIAGLTPELFTAQTGINVEYTVLPEDELRTITTRDLSAGGEQFDVVQIGMFEAPQFGAQNLLFDLNTFALNDPDYDIDDMFPAVRGGLSSDGSLYAAPFYAESSFLMYRADVIEAAGLSMPDAPTWDQVAEIARAIDSDDMAGICLRGKPGWGDLGAAFTTVLNTFGGTWWAANEDGSIGASQVDKPEFTEAANFYVDLLNDAGEDDAANSSFVECLNLYKEGKVAMWYDATVAAGLLEADDSPVKGLNDFALAPTKLTEASGWLWAWALAIPASSSDPATAWEYISWATGPQYLQDAGTALDGGWAAVPPGTRTSLYETPEYQEAAAAFAQKTLDAMNAAPIDNPGTTPRPGLPGVQFVGVPEFQELGGRCTEQLSAAIAGSISVDDAVAACHAIAQEFES